MGKWKTEGMIYDKEGHCGGARNSWLWCGYCDHCYNLSGDRNKKLYPTHDSWAKWLWEQNIETKKEWKKAKQKAYRKLMLKTGNANGMRHSFITIALPKDYSLQKMMKTLCRIQSKGLYGLRESISCVEWFSDQHPDGGNLHIHILAFRGDTKYKPSVIAKQLSKAFKIESNFVDVNNHDCDMLTRLNYICGKKSGTKDDHCSKDRKWRREVNLPDVTSYLPAELQVKVDKILNELQT